MSSRVPTGPAALALFALLLVVACLSLVTAQHRARGLFVELGRAQTQSKELEAEGNRLRIELGKAAQPAAVANAARQLGLRPTEGKQTVFLPVPDDAHVAAAPSLDGGKR
jgi:cell division protein FtsL